MVGYNPGAQSAGPSPKEAALAGSAAGVVTRALISPLDVVKIRFQVSMHPYILCDYSWPLLAFNVTLCGFRFCSNWAQTFPTAPDWACVCTSSRRKVQGSVSGFSAYPFRGGPLCFLERPHPCAAPLHLLRRCPGPERPNSGEETRPRFATTVRRVLWCFFSSPVLSLWLKWSTRWRRMTARRREFTLYAAVWPPALRQWSVSRWTPWGHVSQLRENPR